MIRTLILLTSLLFSSAASAYTMRPTNNTPPRTEYDADPKRTLYIRGMVSNQMINLANQLDNLSRKGGDIYIVINSPGGNVITGAVFLNSMRVAKARGATLKCFVPTLAASMAFIIFGECDERYALPNALLLWHPMRINGGFTKEELNYYEKRIRSMEKLLNTRLLEQMDIDPKVFWYHYKYETLWFAEEVRELNPDFIDIIESYSNVDGAFDLQ